MVTKLDEYENAPTQLREQFAPSPDMIKRTQFESTKRDLRYQVGRVDVPPFATAGNEIKEHPCSGAIFVEIIATGTAQVLMALDNGDWIAIIGGDRIRCSPIEKLRFKRQSGAGTSTVMFIYSNDPMFNFDNGGDFSTRGIWNPAGS